jgi:hypothetical protein
VRKVDEKLKETLASIHTFMKSKDADGYFFHIWKGQEFGGAYSESFTVQDAIQSIYTTIDIFELKPKDVLTHEHLLRLHYSRN